MDALASLLRRVASSEAAANPSAPPAEDIADVVAHVDRLEAELLDACAHLMDHLQQHTEVARELGPLLVDGLRTPMAVRGFRYGLRAYELTEGCPARKRELAEIAANVLSRLDGLLPEQANRVRAALRKEREAQVALEKSLASHEPLRAELRAIVSAVDELGAELRDTSMQSSLIARRKMQALLDAAKESDAPVFWGTPILDD